MLYTVYRADLEPGLMAGHSTIYTVYRADLEPKRRAGDPQIR